MIEGAQQADQTAGSPNRSAHPYDAASSERAKIVDGFAEQREALIRAVDDQRLNAMPEHLRLAAMTQPQIMAAIVAELRQLIAAEVARQLDQLVQSVSSTTKADQTPPASKTDH